MAMSGVAVDEAVMKWARHLFDGFIRVRYYWEGVRPISEVKIMGLLVDERVVNRVAQYPALTFASPQSRGQRTQLVSRRGARIEIQEPPVCEPLLLCVDRFFRFDQGPERRSRYADLVVPTNETKEVFVARVRREKRRRAWALMTAEEGVAPDLATQLFEHCEQPERTALTAVRLAHYLHAVKSPDGVRGYIHALLRRSDDEALAELATYGWDADGSTKIRVHLRGALFLLESGWRPPY